MGAPASLQQNTESQLCVTTNGHCNDSCLRVALGGRSDRGAARTFMGTPLAWAFGRTLNLGDTMRLLIDCPSQLNTAAVTMRLSAKLGPCSPIAMLNESDITMLAERTVRDRDVVTSSTVWQREQANGMTCAVVAFPGCIAPQTGQRKSLSVANEVWLFMISSPWGRVS